MAKLLKLRRGTTTQHGNFTGAEGEVTVDLNKDTLVVHDGSTQGGFPMLRAEGGAQNISTTGTITSNDITISDTNPKINFTDSDHNPDYAIQANSGVFAITDSTNSTDRIRINSDGHIDLKTNVDCEAGLDVTGNIAATGSVTASGNVTTNGDLFVSSTYPRIHMTDTNNNSDYLFVNDNGNFRIYDDTNSAARLSIDAGGTTNIAGNLDVGSGVDVTGNITVSGTVDGRDVAQDGGKIDELYGGSNTLKSTVNIADGVSATTQSQSDNSTKVATTAYVRSAVAGVVDSAPAALDTLNELAAALGDDANYATTTATSIGTKLPKSGGQMTGNITFSGSQTVDGRDLSVDGAKLDNIEAGATADQTKADIDNLGINADTVDSLHAASFLRADAADTAGSDITFNGGSGAITLTVGSDIRGNVGSGWSGEADHKIQWHGNNLYCQYRDDGNFIARDSNGTNNLVLDGSGNATFAGNVTAYSDERLKTNVNTINDALSIVGKLRGVSFDWKETGKHSIGVIAQEVEAVLPEVVQTNNDVDPETGKTTEVKSVDYGKMVGVLINAVNELKAEVTELKVFLLGEELGGK